jgi:hypothetical protein
MDKQTTLIKRVFFDGEINCLEFDEILSDLNNFVAYFRKAQNVSRISEDEFQNNLDTFNEAFLSLNNISEILQAKSDEYSALSETSDEDDEDA